MIILLLAGAAAAYIFIGMNYQTHFLENTTINGIDVSELTVEEAEKLIADKAEDYKLTVTTREGREEVIDGSDFDYHFVSGGEVQRFLDNQNFLMWLPAHMGETSAYTMEASVAWDEELLADTVKNLNCMRGEDITPPQDAYLAQHEDGTFMVVPEVQGNQLDAAKAESLVLEAVKNGEKSVDFQTSDCYLKPEIYATNENLLAEVSIRNRYHSITVTYQMGGGVTETLDSDTIYSWFSLTEDRQPSFDREAVAAWVASLAEKYDTIGRWLPFVTARGETVYPESRTYGWQMDQETETEELYQLLLAGDCAERSPAWLETAWTRGENDLGNTYVEIDYTNQRMWYYKDGVLLVETPVVTGNVNAGNASPEGVFCLVGKSENETLVGEDYKTPVDYWMPFYGGVGIHDADSWRSTYGGDIYQWGGSHGCINTPTAQAAIIYQNIEVGTPVVCYSSGTYYGYETVGTGDASAGDGTSAGNTASGDTASGTGSGENVIDIIDEGTGAQNSGETNTGSSDADSNGDWGSNDSEFPITIEDSWSGEEIVIY